MLLEGEPRLWFMPSCSHGIDLRCALDGAGETAAAGSRCEFPGSNPVVVPSVFPAFSTAHVNSISELTLQRL